MRFRLAIVTGIMAALTMTQMLPAQNTNTDTEKTQKKRKHKKGHKEGGDHRSDKQPAQK